MALLALLPVSFATGALAFAIGTPAIGQTVVAVHAGAGLGVALLSPRKSTVVRRGLRRARAGWQASIALAVLAVVTVLTGIAHSTGLTGLGPVTTMQVHVGAALAIAPLVLWHALARPARPRRTDLSRRSLLRTAGLAGGAGIAVVATERARILTGLPGAERRFTGSHERGPLEPSAMPVTQWLFDRVPQVEPDGWRLQVATPAAARELGLVELDRGEALRATLDCTGGWYSTQDWSGVRLDRLLAEVGRLDGARSVLVRSATGYWRRFGVETLDGLWLATRVGGQPLSAGHGAPVRLVAPGRRGFWWVKWVAEVTADPAPAWQQPPFPTD